MVVPNNIINFLSSVNQLCKTLCDVNSNSIIFFSSDMMFFSEKLFRSQYFLSFTKTDLCNNATKLTLGYTLFSQNSHMFSFFHFLNMKHSYFTIHYKIFALEFEEISNKHKCNIFLEYCLVFNYRAPLEHSSSYHFKVNT